MTSQEKIDILTEALRLIALKPHKNANYSQVIESQIIVAEEAIARVNDTPRNISKY